MNGGSGIVDYLRRAVHAVRVTFHDDLCGHGFPIALEITPPQKPNERILLRRARFLQGQIGAINIIQRPDRQSSLDAAIELAAAGMEPVWHLATRGLGLSEIEQEAARAVACGVRQALVVRGDHAVEGPGEGGPTMRAVIAHLAERFPNLKLGATLNQFQLGNPRTLKNLAGKLEAGAQYVQTQPVFDVRAFCDQIDALKQAHPDVPIVPMVMPLLNSLSAESITRRIGIELPEALHRLLEKEDEAAAWEFFAENVARLRESPLVAGAALMTFEIDPGPDIAEHLRSALSGPVR